MTKSKWAFIEHATDFLTRPRMGDARHPTLWPSEATAVVKDDEGNDKVVGKCRRMTFFRYMQQNYNFSETYSHYKPLVEEIKRKKIPVDRYMLWIWRAGELYEDYLINLAKESGVFVYGQVPVYMKPFNVSGKVDLVTINPDTHLYSMVEVKSVYGFGGNEVLGTPGQRKKGFLGKPRESNIMQIALYDWWGASADDQYEYSRLIYGGRDTGRYAEYAITTERNAESGITEIFYEGIAPNVTQKTKSDITIDSILTQYQYIRDSVDGGHIPERDYELKYSEERIQKLYEAKKLTKTDTIKHEKYLQYKAGERSRSIKPVVKGDWQCNRCSLKDICYKSTNPKHIDYAVPREL